MNINHCFPLTVTYFSIEHMHTNLNKIMFLLILQDILQQKVLITTCLFSLKQDKDYRKT